MRAVILAAGDGGRLLQHTSLVPKPLVPVSGRPLIAYTLDAVAAAGIERAVIVTGYRAAQLRGGVERAAKARLPVEFVANPRFEAGASYSLRAARTATANEPFLLLMADHMLSQEILTALVGAASPNGPNLIATDASKWPADYIEEATRIRLRPGTSEVAAIGKELSPWDALDTGAFLVQPSAWETIDEAPEDCELSTIFAALARQRQLRAVDVSGATWYDVDTLADLEAANRLVAVLPGKDAR